MSVTKYVWTLLCAVLAVMLIIPACGDDDDNDSGTTDSDSGGDSDVDTEVAEGGECIIKIAGSIPATGICKKPADACEGGFSAALPVEAGASQNCAADLDCCSDTDQCEGLKEAVEPALQVTPICTPETGDGACEQDPGLYAFKVGCPSDKPVCCLTPMGDAGVDGGK